MNKLAKIFLNILLDEQQRRDSSTFKGSFVETSVVELIYRYWFETALFQSGFSSVSRECLYPKLESKVGGGKACDLVAFFENNEYWIELKVAYSNTGYTQKELCSDIDKLTESNGISRRMYVVVFIAEGDAMPKKLEGIIDRLKGLSAEVSIESRTVSQPDTWKWSHTSIKVLVATW